LAILGGSNPSRGIHAIGVKFIKRNEENNMTFKYIDIKGTDFEISYYDSNFLGFPYVTLKDTVKNISYPIKRLNELSSKYSRARWLNGASPIMKQFNPSITIDEYRVGEIYYKVWDNTLNIPSDLSYTSIMVEK
jgi:hypothetical protein